MCQHPRIAAPHPLCKEGAPLWGSIGTVSMCDSSACSDWASDLPNTAIVCASFLGAPLMPLGPGAFSPQRQGGLAATDPPPMLPRTCMLPHVMLEAMPALTPALALPPADTVHAVDAHAAHLLGEGASACMPTDDVERERDSTECSPDAQVFGDACLLREYRSSSKSMNYNKYQNQIGYTAQRINFIRPFFFLTENNLPLPPTPNLFNFRPFFVQPLRFYLQ